MHSSPLALLVALIASVFLPPTYAQVAAGGAVGGVPPPVPTQYPVVMAVPKLQTIGGVTTSVQVQFTQTFAAGALETWAWGSVKEGSIGLGGIKGEVGKVKNKGS